MSYSTLLFVSFIFVSIIIDTSIAQKNREVENEISNRGPAPAPNDCSECWCQCKRLSFRDKYGRIHGNCKSSHKGAQWCYVQDNIGYGYSTCNDLRKSAKFEGEAWSYHACTTPAITDYKCQYCQGRRCSPHIRRAPLRSNVNGETQSTISSTIINGSGNTDNIRPRKPTIKAEDPFAEGVLFNVTKVPKNEQKIVF